MPLLTAARRGRSAESVAQGFEFLLHQSPHRASMRIMLSPLDPHFTESWSDLREPQLTLTFCNFSICLHSMEVLKAVELSRAEVLGR